MMRMTLNQVLVLLIVYGCVATSLRPTRRPSYELKPLIGGPAWLPIHLATTVYHSQGSFTMDFIPQDPAASPALLLRGVSVPGKFRVFSMVGEIKVDISPEERVLASSLLDKCAATDPSFDESSLHLVRFNCWSFAWILRTVLLKMLD